VSVLGLALGYLKAMHPVKKPRAEMAATAHILALFVNDPLVKAILPQATSTSTPSKELIAIQSKLTTLEANIASLAKAGKTPPPPTLTTTSKQAQTPQKGALVTQHTYAAKATVPPCPSIVVNAADMLVTWLCTSEQSRSVSQTPTTYSAFSCSIGPPFRCFPALIWSHNP